MQNQLCICIAPATLVVCTCPFGAVCSEACKLKHHEICMRPFVSCVACRDIVEETNTAQCSVCEIFMCESRCLKHSMCTLCRDVAKLVSIYRESSRKLSKDPLSDQQIQATMLENLKTSVAIALQHSKATPRTKEKALLSLK
jgi:hypothetical protein